ncbi:MAG: hypothetical protein R2849_06540 [Thermomicrobiales bacterium]
MVVHQLVALVDDPGKHVGVLFGPGTGHAEAGLNTFIGEDVQDLLRRNRDPRPRRRSEPSLAHRYRTAARPDIIGSQLLRVERRGSRQCRGRRIVGGGGMVAVGVTVGAGIVGTDVAVDGF